MASSSETVKDACEFFKEILLTKDGGPIAYYNLRAYATKASSDVEEFVKKKCKGENLHRFFQKHQDYFLVEKLNVSLKADKFLHCPKERKLKENGEFSKNVNTCRMSSNPSHLKSYPSNDSKQNCSHEDMVEYEMLTKKYFADYLMKNDEIILSDLDLDILPKKVRRFLVKHAGKDTSTFFSRYPDLFFVDKGCVCSMLRSSVEREVSNGEPATDATDKSVSLSSGTESSIESSIQACEESMTFDDASSLSSFRTASDGCPSPCCFSSVSEESLSRPSSETTLDRLSSNAVDPCPRDNARNKELFEHLIDCYYAVHFICYEIIEREDNLCLAYDHKAVKYFVDIIEEYHIHDLKFLQGKLGQAGPDVLQLMKQLYKGDKIKDFFMKHKEFVFDSQFMSVYLSDDYKIHLEETAKRHKSAKKSKMYLENLCGSSWSKLCNSIFQGLYHMSTLLENKQKVRLSRLSGLVSSMRWFLDNMHRLDGKDLSEKLQKLLNNFSFFMPVGENNYALNEDVKYDSFIYILLKLSQELTKEEQNAIILEAHVSLQENCAVESLLKYEALKLKIVEIVDCNLNDIEYVSYSVLPQILGASILHNAFHLSFWCPVIIWILLECDKFVVENGQIRKKKESNQTFSIGDKSGTSHEISPECLETSNKCSEQDSDEHEPPGIDSFNATDFDQSSCSVNETSQFVPESLPAQNELETCQITKSSFCSNTNIESVNDKKVTSEIVPDSLPSQNEQETCELRESLFCDDTNRGSVDDKKVTSQIVSDSLPAQNKLETCELRKSSFCDDTNIESVDDKKATSQIVPDSLPAQNKPETCEIRKSSFCDDTNIESVDDKKVTSQIVPDSLLAQNKPETCQIRNSSFCDNTDIKSIDNRTSDPSASCSTLDKNISADHGKSFDSSVKISLVKLMSLAIKKSGQSVSEVHLQSDSVEGKVCSSDSTCVPESCLDQKVQDLAFSVNCVEEPSIDLSTACELEECAKASEILSIPTLLPDCNAPKEKVGSRKSFECLLSCYYSVQYFCLVVECFIKAREFKAVKFFEEVLKSDSGGTFKTSLKSLQRKISKADEVVCDLVRNDYPGKSLKKFFIERPEFVFNLSDLTVQLSVTHSAQLNERSQISPTPVLTKQFLEKICDSFWAENCASTFGVLVNWTKKLRDVKHVSFDFFCELVTDFNFFPFFYKLGKLLSERLIYLLHAFKIVTPIQDNNFELSPKACEENEEVFYYPLAILSYSKSEEEQSAVIKTVHDTHLSMCYSNEFLNYDDLCAKVVEHVNVRLCNSSSMSLVELPWVLGEYILHSAYHLDLKYSDLAEILFNCELFEFEHFQVKKKQSNETSKHKESIIDISVEKESIKDKEPIAIINEVSENNTCVDSDLKYDFSAVRKEQATVSHASENLESVECAMEKESVEQSVVPCDSPVSCDNLMEKNLVFNSHNTSNNENIKIPLLKVLSLAFKKSPKASLSSKDSSLDRELDIPAPIEVTKLDLDHKTVDSAPSTAASVKDFSKKKKKPIRYVVPQSLKNSSPSADKSELNKYFECMVEGFFTVQFCCFQVSERQAIFFEQIKKKTIKFFVDTLKLMPGYKGSLKQLKRKLRKADADVVNHMTLGPIDNFFTHCKEFVYNPSNSSVSLSDDYETQLETTTKYSSSPIKSKEYIKRLCSLAWVMLCAETFQWLEQLANLLRTREKVKFSDMTKKVSWLNQFLGKFLDEEDKLQQLKTILKSFKCITYNEHECSWNGEVKMQRFVLFFLHSLQDKYSEEQQVYVLQSAHVMYHNKCSPERFLTSNELSFKILERLKFKLHEVSSLKYSELPHIFGAYILHSAFHLGLQCSDLIWIIWDSDLFDFNDGVISRKKGRNSVENVYETSVVNKLREANSIEEEQVAFTVDETSEKNLSNDDNHGKMSDEGPKAESSPLCQETNPDLTHNPSTLKHIQNSIKAETPVVFNSSLDATANSELDNSEIRISDAQKKAELKKSLCDSDLSQSQIPVSSSEMLDDYTEPNGLKTSYNTQHFTNVLEAKAESLEVYVDGSNEPKDGICVKIPDSDPDPSFKSQESTSKEVSGEEFDIFKFALDVEKGILNDVIKKSFCTESTDSEDYSHVTLCAVVDETVEVDDRLKVPSSNSIFQKPKVPNITPSPLNDPRTMGSVDCSEETSSNVTNGCGNQDDLLQSSSQNCFPEKSFRQNENSSSDILSIMEDSLDCSERKSLEKVEDYRQDDKLQLFYEKEMNSVLENSYEQNETSAVNLLTMKKDSLQCYKEESCANDIDHTKSQSSKSGHEKSYSSGVCMNNLTEKRYSFDSSEETASVTLDKDCCQDDLKSHSFHPVLENVLQKSTISSMNHDSTFLQPLKAKVMLMSMDTCIAKYFLNGKQLLMFCLKPTFHCDKHDCGECFETLHVGETVLCYVYSASSTCTPGKVLFPYMFCREQESDALCCQDSKTSGGLYNFESQENECVLLDSQKVSSRSSRVHSVEVQDSAVNTNACNIKNQAVSEDGFFVSKSTSSVQTDIVLQENFAQTEIGGSIKPCFRTVEKGVNASCTFLTQEIQASSELSESGSQTVISSVLKSVGKQSQTCIIQAHKHMQTVIVQASNCAQTSISGSVKPNVESCPSASQTSLSGDVTSCPQSATASCQTISPSVPVISQFIQTAPQSLSIAKRFSLSVGGAHVVNQSVQCEPSIVETCEASVCTNSSPVRDSGSQTLSTGVIMVMNYLP